ncbi:MAG: ABC transporter ATP-binding protein [Actinomycetaceae bacterium]
MRQALSKDRHFQYGAGVAEVSPHEASDAVVRGRGLVKAFGDVRALDSFDLTVRPGEVHGFLGPNGAGKSTTIRAILGQLRLDSGELEVLGRHPWHDAVAVHARLAYVPAGASLWPSLTGGECIDLLGSLRGGQDQRMRDELVERFELDTSRRSRSYSTGNRQKVALVAALSADADLYVLDEPTGGLDPLMEEVFRERVRELRAEGRTVLLSSHLLDEVEALCDRVTIIRRGRAVSTGTLDELRAGTTTTVEATITGEVPDLAALGAEGVERIARDGGTHVTARVDRDSLARVVTAVAATDPVSLTVRPPDLDEVFMGHYVDVERAGAPAGSAR